MLFLCGFLSYCKERKFVHVNDFSKYFHFHFATIYFVTLRDRSVQVLQKLYIPNEPDIPIQLKNWGKYSWLKITNEHEQSPT